MDVRLSEGYGLLHELLSKQAGLDGILVVKGASPQTAGLLSEIAAASREGAERLRGFANADERLRVDWTGLREVELRVRGQIESTTGRELLFAKKDFEVRVLLTQSEATRYGAQLARVVGGLDKNAERSGWAKGFADRYAALRERVVGQLRVAGE